MESVMGADSRVLFLFLVTQKRQGLFCVCNIITMYCIVIYKLVVHLLPNLSLLFQYIPVYSNLFQSIVVHQFV